MQYSFSNNGQKIRLLDTKINMNYNKKNTAYEY